MKKHKLLITNDDGISSPGLCALIDEFSDKEHYDLKIIAPKYENSWRGKSVSSHIKVKHQIISKDDLILHALEGTPADCVLIGCFHVCEELPDLVISGINFGANIGNSFILSSATVGAAMEASFLGIKSIAVSLLLNPLKKDIKIMKDKKADLHINKNLKKEDFNVAAKITKKIADFVLENPNLPPKTDLININVPSEATLDSEIHITSVSRAHYGNVFKKIDDEKEDYYIFNRFARGGKYQFIKGTDIHSTFIKNSISITPIMLDLSGDVEKLAEYFKKIL
ncbi:MAG: 5'/3'-nucleotidase SurE [Candidatus Lokiarchaeota archaeon]|nr:5'/3'-nucleotidase SurE [Candidatus Lokiarchaeota archaeon]